MLFNSFSFLIFFPVVVLVYGLIPKKLRTVWLLVSSYYFYMSWNAAYAALIAFSTLTTWGAARLMENKKTRTRRMLLILNLVINFGILFFFKYFNFFFTSLGFSLRVDVLLPVGISFYTFQAVGYTIDVYRGETEAEKNILRYALFVSFFPQLVAGPIERSKGLLTQIQNIEHIRFWNHHNITTGFGMMIWGLFQKMVIADRISVIADTVFAQPYKYGSIELIVGALAFSIQIYCDFNAYSVIAKGAARVMGLELMDNFDTPYFAQGITDFWKRWHISLSTWFRDYLYIPLGGNRKGTARRYINLMLTFVLSGLWHGAAWTFAAWGALHGLYRIGAEVTRPFWRALGERLKIRTDVFSFRLLRALYTSILAGLAWVLFRAESIADAWYYLHRMFTRWNPWVLFNGGLYGLGLDRFEANVLQASLLVLIAGGSMVRLKTGKNMPDVLAEQNLWFRWAVLIGLVVWILVYGRYGIDFDSAQFIYFQF